MKFGELINKNEIVVNVFTEEGNRLATEIAHRIKNQDMVTINCVDMDRNTELCEALQVKKTTVFIYNHGNQFLQINSDDAEEITEKINELITTGKLTK